MSSAHQPLLSFDDGFELHDAGAHLPDSLGPTASAGDNLAVVRHRSVSAALKRKAQKMESFDFGPYDSEVRKWVLICGAVAAAAQMRVPVLNYWRCGQINRVWDEGKDHKYFRRVDVARWVMTFIIGAWLFVCRLCRVVCVNCAPTVDNVRRWPSFPPS